MNRPSDLNDAQWRAVSFGGNRLLIVAGPGTGKTHTLTRRIVSRIPLLREGERVLAVTFTNKAAREMRERLDREGTVCDGNIFVGTFHRFCLLILRSQAREAGLPEGFNVASPEDVRRFAKDIWPEKKNKELKLLTEEISRYKSLAFNEPEPVPVTVFNGRLREKGLLDFDDLILETLRLLERRPEVLRAVRNRYRDIYVDEFQDINAVQHALLKLLAGGENGVTAIGDPNQAIYGFRGADVRFFEGFAGDFPGAEVRSLSESYRSCHNLLSACGQVMAGHGTLSVPALTARIFREGRLTINRAATDKAEAEYIVHQIEKIVGGIGMFSRDSGRVDAHEEGQYTFGDVAVLYRLNSQARVLKEACDRLGLPVRISQDAPETDGGEIVDDVFFDGVPEPGVDGERVSLMTLHAAKGLEFPVVFIAGCEEGLIPLGMEGLTSHPEEERRLFYVGMTRAKERLYLIHAQKRFLYGKTMRLPVSAFLADIREELKEYEKSFLKKSRVRKSDDQLSLFGDPRGNQK